MSVYGAGPYGAGLYGQGGATIRHAFTTPTVRRARGTFFGRRPVYDDLGVTVLQEGTSVRQVESPSDEEVAAATRVYLGGRSYNLSEDEVTTLTEAGYGSHITTS